MTPPPNVVIFPKWLHWATIFNFLNVVLIFTTDVGYFCSAESDNGVRFSPSGQVFWLTLWINRIWTSHFVFICWLSCCLVCRVWHLERGFPISFCSWPVPFDVKELNSVIHIDFVQWPLDSSGQQESWFEKDLVTKSITFYYCKLNGGQWQR